MDDARAEALNLVRRIRSRFPEDSSATDSWLIDRGCELAELTHIWVEAFADRTSDAIRAKDSTKIREHTEFMSNELQRGSEQLRHFIDVAYAENLMWDLGNPDRVWGWPYISPAVRELFQNMWGAPKMSDEGS
jgi:hypothetical protein